MSSSQLLRDVQSMPSLYLVGSGCSKLMSLEGLRKEDSLSPRAINPSFQYSSLPLEHVLVTSTKGLFSVCILIVFAPPSPFTPDEPGDKDTLQIGDVRYVEDASEPPPDAKWTKAWRFKRATATPSSSSSSRRGKE